LDSSEMLPVVLPTAVGLNVRVIGVLAPVSGRLIGNCADGTLNNGLSTLVPVTVRVPAPAPPVFDRDTVWLEVVPTCTDPKL